MSKNMNKITAWALFGILICGVLMTVYAYSDLDLGHAWWPYVETYLGEMQDSIDVCDSLIVGKADTSDINALDDSLASYPDTTITNALTTRIDSANSAISGNDSSISDLYDTLGSYPDTSDLDYTDSSDVAGWNYVNNPEYTDSSDVAVWNYVNDPDYTDSSDVSGWNYVNDPDYTDSTDVAGWNYVNDPDYTDSSDVSGWNYIQEIPDTIQPVQIGASGNCVQRAYLDTIIGCSPVVFMAAPTINFSTYSYSIHETLWVETDTNYTSTDTTTASESDTVCMSSALYYYGEASLGARQDITGSGSTIDTIWNVSGFTFSDSCPAIIAHIGNFQFCEDTVTIEEGLPSADTLALYVKTESCSGEITDSIIGYWDGEGSIEILCEYEYSWVAAANDTCIRVEFNYERYINTGINVGYSHIEPPFYKITDFDTTWDGAETGE